MYERLAWYCRNLACSYLAPELGVSLSANKFGVLNKSIKSSVTNHSNALQRAEALTVGDLYTALQYIVMCMLYGDVVYSNLFLAACIGLY